MGNVVGAVGLAQVATTITPSPHPYTARTRAHSTSSGRELGQLASWPAQKPLFLLTWSTWGGLPAPTQGGWHSASRIWIRRVQEPSGGRLNLAGWLVSQAGVGVGVCLRSW